MVYDHKLIFADFIIFNVLIKILILENEYKDRTDEISCKSIKLL